VPTFIVGLFLLYLLLAAIKRFGRMTPADAAKLVRKGGVALGIAGLALTALRGRFGILGALASALLGLSGRQTFPGPGGAFRDVGAGAGGRRSTSARSAWIEMRLDLDSGAIQGFVTAGPYQGRELAALDRTELTSLYAACRREDPDGARLLEAYLDRRFAGWRDADESQAEARGRGGGNGAMTRDEAYEILGLPKGASAEEIIHAHRVLMKKVHPDLGGSAALAARVNQAKEVLLDRHG
jgi:hypothetical protein